MKLWQPISNGGKFFVQFAGHILHEDSRGCRIQYRSIENARKAADRLNTQMIRDAWALTTEAHEAKRVIDHINGDLTDNRLENLRVVTLTAWAKTRRSETLTECWVLMKRGKTHGLLPGLITLLAFPSEQAAKSYAKDTLGLGVLDYQARNLEVRGTL